MLRLMGDSHAIAFSAALESTDEGLLNELKHTFGGMQAGMLQIAKTFDERFHLADGEVVSFVNPDVMTRLQSLFALPDLRSNIITEPLVLSMGFHFIKYYKRPVFQRYALVPVKDKMFMSSGVFSEFVASNGQAVLEFTQDLVARGFNLVYVESPALRRNVPKRADVNLTDAEAVEICRQHRAAMRRHIEGAGARVISFANTRDRDGFLKLEYENPNDGHHANAAYGRMAIRHLLDIADLIKERSAKLPAYC